jgi:hypothetical protein
MTTKKVILISGYAQAGKDTLADAIESYAPTKRLKFATALRTAAEKALKSLGVSIDVWSEDPAVKTIVRPFLIELARLARAIDRDVFARKTLQDAIYALSVNGDKTVVITDCRYDNEYSIFKDAGKQLEWEVIRIHIERTGGKPAHDEELLSVVTLEAKYPADWKVGFEDGDIQGIKRFAEMFVASALAKETVVT